jgi:hypothetical protein
VAANEEERKRNKTDRYAVGSRLDGLIIPTTKSDTSDINNDSVQTLFITVLNRGPLIIIIIIIII